MDEFREVAREGDDKELFMALFDTAPQDLARAPEARQRLQRATYANGDIANGGFAQYFGNRHEHDALVDDLKALEMHEHARIAESALAKRKAGTDDFSAENTLWFAAMPEFDRRVLAFVRARASELY